LRRGFQRSGHTESLDVQVLETVVPAIDHRADVAFSIRQSEIVLRRKAHHGKFPIPFRQSTNLSLTEMNSLSGSSAGKSLSKTNTFCRTVFLPVDRLLPGHM
jgi:hypothetical protein